MKMTVVDRSTLTQLRAALNAALAPVAKAHGITLKLGNCTFDRSGHFKYTLEGAGAGAVSKDAQAWRDYAGIYQWDPELAGKPVRYAGEEYTLLGYLPRRDKLLLARNGKEYTIKRAAIVGMVPA